MFRNNNTKRWIVGPASPLKSDCEHRGTLTENNISVKGLFWLPRLGNLKAFDSPRSTAAREKESEVNTSLFSNAAAASFAYRQASEGRRKVYFPAAERARLGSFDYVA